MAFKNTKSEFNRLSSTSYYVSGKIKQFHSSLEANSLAVVLVKLWGAGGGGGTAGGWSFGAEGGGGGYVTAEFAVPRSSSLTLQVGEGGLVNGSRMSYGGGGQANRTGSDNRYGSNGGGYTGLFLGPVTQGNALAIAGGGGGGGSSRAGTGNIGGAGGGPTGQDGVSAYDSKPGFRGTGGTQSAGGNCPSQANSYTAGALEGGTAGTNGYGGAGGGGYYGGGAGGYSEPNTMAGGGGGSGYVNTLYTTPMYTPANSQGNYRTSAGTTDPGWPGSVATGGAVGTAGLHGFARITINGVETTYSYTGSNVTIPLVGT